MIGPNIENPLEGLKDAIKSGYGDLEELKTDENFALLRDNDEFKKLIEDKSEGLKVIKGTTTISKKECIPTTF